MTAPQIYFDLLTDPAATPGAGLESAPVRPRQTAPDPSELHERLLAEIAYIERKTGLRADPEAVERLIGDADEGVRKVLGEDGDVVLGPTERAGLEAVVKVDGSRPVLFVEDDFVDVLAPSAGTYALSLLRVSARCEASVGRSGGSTIPLRTLSSATRVLPG